MGWVLYMLGSASTQGLSKKREKVSALQLDSDSETRKWETRLNPIQASLYTTMHHLAHNSQVCSCETPENPNFLRNDKMVILVKIQNFSRSRMTKQTSPLKSSLEI